MKIDIKEAEISILLEIDGEVHLVGLDKDKFSVIKELIKSSTKLVIPTGRTQMELRTFLNYTPK